MLGLYYDDELEESELIPQAQAILQANPNVVYEKDENGWTLLHHAAHRYLSPEVCQMLISLNKI